MMFIIQALVKLWSVLSYPLKPTERRTLILQVSSTPLHINTHLRLPICQCFLYAYANVAFKLHVNTLTP